MDANQIAAIALAVAALALLLIAGLVLARIAASRRSERTLVHALDQRAQQSAARVAANAAAGKDGATKPANNAANSGADGKTGPRKGFKGLLDSLALAGIRWLDTPLGRKMVADEDRRFLEQCGFIDTRTRGLFLMTRIAGAIVLPLIASVLASGHLENRRYLALVVGMVIVGFLAPKIYIQRRASNRRLGVVDELPMLVDLLRLLQGVGLSLDQSLQVMVSDFKGVLPILSGELEIAQRQFAAGRTREQSLQRLASSYDNEDMRAVVRLLIQVDRHGGAVQEPLKQFGERLRETRRAMLRDRIGRMSVKMTGVMIMTLLPALMIVTAGPGVLAVTHSLKSMKR
ncbi:type II secretion system F family protein [Paraburkholderia sp. DHOC27]|uniref:type II secretion system F family protein n=1 Tax=Paraburkholderia sp. DHOC27 TaxID=2303330 RepID=UPI000E3E025F|nr:type II secretion system F family protein [Paraburkholderia sp. DHOC27]RFU48241.1 type II secretion system F family protein [Paraburkholderia sp. DHOC27]